MIPFTHHDPPLCPGDEGYIEGNDGGDATLCRSVASITSWGCCTRRAHPDDELHAAHGLDGRMMASWPVP